MECPVCAGVHLVMSERQGVEIDYCPQCRGVWLDRGELDKIIERSGQSEPAMGKPHYRDEEPDSDRHGPRGHHGGHYRKRSWLSDLFD